MSFFKQISDNIAKIKSYEDDIAPMGFYFDIYTVEPFNIPLLSIPLRIDKISNGEPTLLISPDVERLKKVSDTLNLYINFEQFVLKGLTNLIAYSREKYKELTYRELDNDKILEWYYRSLLIETEILALKNDFTFLLEEYLTVNYNINKKELEPGMTKYKAELIQFCDNVLKYFRSRLEKNEIKIKSEGKIIKKEIYKKRRSKYYPLMVKIKIKKRNEDDFREMSFVPYLIYDDIMDIFYFNKKLLSENQKEPINLKVYSENNIIIKGSNIFDNRFTKNQKIYNNVKISTLEKILNENRKK